MASILPASDPPGSRGFGFSLPPIWPPIWRPQDLARTAPVTASNHAVPTETATHSLPGAVTGQQGNGTAVASAAAVASAEADTYSLPPNHEDPVFSLLAQRIALAQYQDRGDQQQQQ